VKIALAQINPTVGDLVGNRKLVQEAVARAVDARADLVLLSEMVLCGYPPMDLLRRDGFVRDQLRELDALLPASRDVAIALGAVLPWPGGRPNALVNAAVLLAGGKQVAVQPKSLLPNYDVFDERRYFASAEERSTVGLPGRDEILGLTVCEDTWVDDVPYDINPVQELAAAGADCILNPSASPWHVNKPKRRRELLAGLASANHVPIAFVNQVGGNDELIFDGGSFAVDARGRIIASLPLFDSGFTVVDVGGGSRGVMPQDVEDPSPAAQLEAGLAIGIRDYFLKQSLPPGAVIGLSGGIDSAVTAHLAAEALGAERVVGIAMPGPFSSGHSVEDALALGRNLGIDVRTVDINPIYESYREAFGDLFGKRNDYGLTQQNIQSRIRGAILMAVSNEEQRLVLATGNKSELSLGYCTLYGDTVGGLAVLGDVYKRDVYALARYANERAGRERIPRNTIEKPPSAELAPNQKDENDLPPYDFVDRVLEQVIEGERGATSVEPPEGGSREVAQGIVSRLDRNEYKRRQSPLVLRTSPKAFGSGRRLPIVHRYKD
jgi:NAD+ synthase (glutamine-hydrolysing)